ncbi:TPA: hypothetical protein ACX6S0_002620 [Photobacterium damselae]
MKKISLIALLLSSQVMATSSYDTWIHDNQVSVGDNNAGFFTTRIQTDSNTCEPIILIGLAKFFDRSRLNVNIINVNGVNVKVEYFGKTNFGTDYVTPITQRGSDYVINEFKRSNSVQIKMEGYNRYTFTAGGFTKALNNRIASCEKKNKMFDSAL